MLTGNFTIQKKFSVRNKTLEVTLKSKYETISYLFNGDEVFTGDYWNTVYFNNQLYDINFFKYPRYKLAFYKVIDGVADYSNFVSV
jgi:hypothetical protein